MMDHNSYNMRNHILNIYHHQDHNNMDNIDRKILNMSQKIIYKDWNNHNIILKLRHSNSYIMLQNN